MAAESGPPADAAGHELTGRHLDAAAAYAARCAATPQGAALLASSANGAALHDFLSNGAETAAWRPHVLATLLRTAAEWARDSRRHRLSPELLEWLTSTDAALGQDDEQVPLVVAFHRLPVRLQIVLWHVAVEQDGPQTVARHLGADLTSVQAWTPGVENRFRNAFVGVLEEHAAPACRPFTRILVSASESEPRRAVAASVATGLDQHLTECLDCSRALRDLSRLRDGNCGTALAEALIPWGGVHYHSDRFTAGARTPRALRPVHDPRHDRPPQQGLFVTERLRTLRHNPGALGAMAACAVLAVVAAWPAVPGPGPETRGERVAAPSWVNGRGILPADDPDASPSQSSPEKEGDEAPGSKSPATKEPPAPKPSPSRPSALPLAVPGAELRWDFSTPQRQVKGTPSGRLLGDARHSRQRGGSVEFTADGYAQSDRAVISTERSFTVSAWVRLTSTSGFRTVAGQDGRNVSGFFLQYSADDDRWRLAMGHSDSAGGDECDALSLAPPKLGQWQHLTAVIDAGEDELLLYVDGALQERQEHSPVWSADGRFSVGRGQWEGGPSDLFQGGIDDVRVYDRALPASEVGKLAKARPNA
ncbi:LamG-like jellyroll fold domain-containing protein [Streptomyces sp. NPDC006475]|uniref:LamG domain-containing protein n=1 Tax=Streptomyces sp. NPDC006475 TaxID=3155719 RepID=UPI0033AF20B5